MKSTLCVAATTSMAIAAAIAAWSEPTSAADDDAKAAVAAAVKRLAEQPSFSWQTTTQAGGGPVRGFRAPGFVGGDPTTGQFESGGYTSVKQANLQFVTKGGKAAVLYEDLWMAPEQAAARSGDGQRGPGQFNAAAITAYKLPGTQAQEYLEKAADFRRDGDAIVGTLSAQTVSDLLSGGPGGGFGQRGGGPPPGAKGGKGAGPPAGGRGGRGGNPYGGAITSPQGSVTFWIKDGVLTKFSVGLSGSREFRGEAVKLDRTTATTITDIGSTKPNLAPDAKDIVDALVAETKPSVFIPEPGFTRLFNGRDLTGWAGRPEHWSVEDGAIVGRTTPEKPARGNNFLIAKNSDKNLLVDDFELRFSYKISVSGNSGIQYRSIERDNYVVAGYQADFDGAQRFSGILYDEAGGAGGRGIMAMRGEKVLWNAEGKKEVTGRVADAEKIQAAIKNDDWNDYVVIVRGNHLQHFINGVPTVDVIDDTDAKRLTSGILALQIHAGPPMTVWFKNIRIKPLNSAAENAAGNVKVAKD